MDILIERQEFIPYETLLVPLARLNHEGQVTTLFVDFAVNCLCNLITTNKCYQCIQQGNKLVYVYMKRLDKNIYGTDMATSRLCLATFFLQQGDYSRSSMIISYVLSSIPPYAQYYSLLSNSSNDLSKQLYVNKYCTRNLNIIRKAKEAWLKDMRFTPAEYPFLPSAIQVELCYCPEKFGVLISPFTYAYYLMFLCYHGLGQCDNRDRALRQLVDTVNDDERRCVVRFHSYNIAGHCMLMAGYVEMARELFLISAQFTHNLRSPVFDKYNSAYKYLSLM